jgi:hypothetical protein
MLLNVTIKGYTIYSDKKEIEALRQCRGLFFVYKHQRHCLVSSFGGDDVKYRFSPSGRPQSVAAYGACFKVTLNYLKGCEGMLTQKQENFAKAIALDGMSYSDAYRSAYNTKSMSDKTINEKASLLKDQDKIRARIKELSDKVNTPKIMSAQKRKEWLTEVINNEDVDINARLKASDQLNRMEGEYVTKIDGNLNVAKLEDLI